MPQSKPVALITGASQGLGAAIALRLAREGYDIAVTELSRPPLDDVLARLESAGAKALPIVLDLCAQESVEQAVSDTARTFGRLDALVNNAGVTLRADAVDVTREAWQAVIDVNLTGTFFMCRQMARYAMQQKRPARIVSIASTHGVVALAQRSTYGISKAGIVHMTRMLAYEWAPHDIRVNAVAPGTVETPSRAAYFAENPQARESMLARVPVGRFATAADVAGAVAYLAGPDGEFVTGQTLLVDGGLTTY